MIKKILNLFPLSHCSRPFTLNTCGAAACSSLSSLHDNDQSSPDEHDPRSASVTADNFIDNCHASNHARRHSVHPTRVYESIHAYTCSYTHTRTYIRLSVHSRSSSGNRIAAARRQPHRYRASLGNRHPSLKFACECAFDGGEREGGGESRSGSREKEEKEKRESPRSFAACSRDADRGVAFKRR